MITRPQVIALAAAKARCVDRMSLRRRKTVVAADLVANGLEHALQDRWLHAQALVGRAVELDSSWKHLAHVVTAIARGEDQE